jgi:hypothetical protein
MLIWTRRKLRRYGIELPFTAVICPRYLKTITIDDAATVQVAVERTLVFLREPEPGDLRDLIPLPPGDGAIERSPDSVELRRKTGAAGTTIYWLPRERVVRYALYEHRYGWRSAGFPGEAALYTEFSCEHRTGMAQLEIIAPRPFETAVAFRRPPWRRMGSVERLVKHALRQLEQSQGQRPELTDHGSRLVWTLTQPRIGERYACVAFHEHGVALWQNRLEASSLTARLRRLVRVVTPF